MDSESINVRRAGRRRAVRGLEPAKKYFPVGDDCRYDLAPLANARRRLAYACSDLEAVQVGRVQHRSPAQDVVLYGTERSRSISAEAVCRPRHGRCGDGP